MNFRKANLNDVSEVAVLFRDLAFHIKNASKDDYWDFEEMPLNVPLDIVVDKDMFYFNNKMFACIPEKMDYAGIKTRLITSRYSNDDQMALILNHGKSEEDTELFNKMQEWRDWAGEVAKIVVIKVEEQSNV